jgi:hypothetical protein
MSARSIQEAKSVPTADQHVEDEKFTEHRMQKKIQKIIIPLIVISTSSLLAISVGLYGVAYYILSNASKNSTPVVVGDPILKFDRHLGFKANSNARSLRTFSSLSYEIVTDSNGARISSPDEKTVNATTPITIVGCSFTWGHGVSNEETYSRILQNDLDTKVNNYAMGSYGGVASLKSMQQHGDGSKLIIYGFIDSHVWRNIAPCAPTYGSFCLYAPTVRRNDKGAFFIEDEVPSNNLDVTQLYFDLVREGKLNSLNNFWLGAKYLQNGVDQFLGRHDSTLAKENAIDGEKFVIEQMAAYADKVGAKLLVVNVGVGQPHAFFDKLSNMDFGKNVYFLEASQFPDRRVEDLVLKNDGHPSPLGQKLIADRIRQEIEQKSVSIR